MLKYVFSIYTHVFIFKLPVDAQYFLVIRVTQASFCSLAAQCIRLPYSGFPTTYRSEPNRYVMETELGSDVSFHRSSAYVQGFKRPTQAFHPNRAGRSLS